MNKPIRKDRNQKPKLLAQKAGESSTPIMTYIGVFGICGYLLLVGLAQIFLQNKTANVENEIRQERESLKKLRKVCNNLNLDRERHKKASFILPRARRLGLQQPFPGQVRHMPGVQLTNSEHKTIVDGND